MSLFLLIGRSLMKKYIYGFLMLFIVGVSAYDIYVTVVLQDYIQQFEANPLHRYMMFLTGGVALSVSLRFAVTATSCMASVIAYNMNRKMHTIAWYCTIFIAIVHAYLLFLLIYIMILFNNT